MPQLLLDTHILLWYAQGDAKLSVAAAESIRLAGADCCISRATLWEVAIKNGSGKLDLRTSFANWQALVQTQEFSLLEISDSHLVALNQLPYIGDHRDPFDRLLIAQALSDDLTLVSRDAKFKDYAGLKLNWV